MTVHSRTGQIGRRRQASTATLTESVAAEIRHDILNGTIAEGTVVRQESLAARYGVSRIPVREALKQLDTEGLVIMEPHRGTRVTKLSLDEIRELFAIRALIESDTLRRAVPKLTPRHLELAAAILADYEAALGDPQRGAEWGAYNWRFHSTLYAASQRQHALQIIQRLHTNTDRYSRLILKIDWARAETIKEHRKILEYCHLGEVDLAAEYQRTHSLSACQILVSYLESQRLQEGG